MHIQAKICGKARIICYDTCFSTGFVEKLHFILSIFKEKSKKVLQKNHKRDKLKSVDATESDRHKNH